MKEHTFTKGDIVQIINEEHMFQGQVCQIIVCAMTRYLQHLSDGQKIWVSNYEISRQLGDEQERELYKAQLIQMQHLAVDLGDEQWFNEIRAKLDSLVEAS